MLSQRNLMGKKQKLCQSNGLRYIWNFIPIKSLTANNGRNFYHWVRWGLDVYFAQAYSSYERQWTTIRVHSEGSFKPEPFRGRYRLSMKRPTERILAIYQSAKSCFEINSRTEKLERDNHNQRTTLLNSTWQIRVLKFLNTKQLNRKLYF